MGGDFAPKETVAGAVAAAPEMHGTILLVGRTEDIKRVHPGSLPSNIEIIEASEVVEMHDEPVSAVRRKKNSSLVMGADLVKRGEADAFISAGNTGAVTAAAHMMWRTIPNITRPAIATVIPSKKGCFVLVDSGATVDADPENLFEFAIMGSVYAELVLGLPSPKIALLNIGEEESKGNQLTKAAYKLLNGFPGFVGNIEGKHLFDRDVDVVVCDAFVGNVVLKTAQGLGAFLINMFKESAPKNPIMRLPLVLLRGGINRMRQRMDYAEHGGAPLLGVDGLCFICHGHSNAKAIKNALLMAQKGHDKQLVSSIAEKAAYMKLKGEPVVGV
ncbi:MAG: phosphate acyltransferase PlsX [Fimbriimonadales bacterium]